MQLNTLITELKAKLPIKEDILVDGGYLEPAIKVMYEYYLKSPEERSQKVFEYFTVTSDFKFLNFLKAYIMDITGYDVKLTYTQDDWLKIELNN